MPSLDFAMRQCRLKRWFDQHLVLLHCGRAAPAVDVTTPYDKQDRDLFLEFSVKVFEKSFDAGICEGLRSALIPPMHYLDDRLVTILPSVP